MKRNVLLIIAIAFIFTGCYHTQVTTGLESSNEVYQKAWASSFIAGLVPPDIIHAEQHCANGVARVETRHSFLNMVAQFVTFSLYSPMEITVVCAAPTRADATTETQMIEVAKNSAPDVVIETFNEAAKRSAESKQPVYVSFK